MSVPGGVHGMDDPVTEEQEAALERVHNIFGVKSWMVMPEGHIEVVLDDGDDGYIGSGGGNTWGA
jgi:hypothetical protein